MIKRLNSLLEHEVTPKGTGLASAAIQKDILSAVQVVCCLRLQAPALYDKIS